MAAYAKYLPGVDGLVKAINAGTDTYKVALSNTFTNTDSTFTPGTSDMATGNGYTQGGNAAAVASANTVAGVFKLVLSSPAVWTFSGAVGPWRYAILWNVTNSVPLGSWDYGSSINAVNGDTFTITLDAANGVFTDQ